MDTDVGKHHGHACWIASLKRVLLSTNSRVIESKPYEQECSIHERSDQEAERAEVEEKRMVMNPLEKQHISTRPIHTRNLATCHTLSQNLFQRTLKI